VESITQPPLKVLNSGGIFLYDSDMILKPLYTLRPEQARISPHKPLFVQPMHVRADVAAHDHEYYEICIVTAGSARHLSSRGADFLRPGSTVIIAPGDVHAFDQLHNFRVINMYYLSEWLADELRPLRDAENLIRLFLSRHLFARARGETTYITALSRRELADSIRELKEAETELRADHPSILLLRAITLKLLIRLSRAIARTQPHSSTPQLRPEVHAMLDAVERLVERGEPLRVSAVAETSGLSTDHAARLVREAIGQSLGAYYQRRRVQRAGLLLMDDQLRITDVAQRLGYTDSAHFTRMFRKHQGCSPRDFRRRPAADHPQTFMGEQHRLSGK